MWPRSSPWWQAIFKSTLLVAAKQYWCKCRHLSRTWLFWRTALCEHQNAFRRHSIWPGRTFWNHSQPLSKQLPGEQKTSQVPLKSHIMDLKKIISPFFVTRSCGEADGRSRNTPCSWNLGQSCQNEMFHRSIVSFSHVLNDRSEWPAALATTDWSGCVLTRGHWAKRSLSAIDLNSQQPQPQAIVVHQSQRFLPPTWATCDPKRDIKKQRHPKLQKLQFANELGSKRAKLSAKTPTHRHPYWHHREPVASSKRSLQPRLPTETALLWALWPHPSPS